MQSGYDKIIMRLKNQLQNWYSPPFHDCSASYKQDVGGGVSSSMIRRGFKTKMQHKPGNCWKEVPRTAKKKTSWSTYEDCGQREVLREEARSHELFCRTWQWFCCGMCGCQWSWMMSPWRVECRGLQEPSVLRYSQLHRRVIAQQDSDPKRAAWATRGPFGEKRWNNQTIKLWKRIAKDHFHKVLMMSMGRWLDVGRPMWKLRVATSVQ